jgi:hypothetical protein
MNYVDDDWMNEFTPGQIERIWTQIALFRSELATTADLREAASAMELRW